MAEDKVTVVVSPLIALIKDQIEHLQKLKIVAESINSKMGERDRKRVIDDLNCKVNVRLKTVNTMAGAGGALRFPRNKKVAYC